MSTKNAIAANEGTAGNMGGDTYAQGANLANAMQDALAGNLTGSLAEGADQEADLHQDADVEQTDQNSVGMDITF